MKVDPAWAHRRLLLRAGNELSPKALARLKAVFETDDPTNEISAAWGVKELLAQMLRGPRPERVQPPRDLHSPNPVPAGLRGRRHARSDPARRDDREVVAGDRRIPGAGKTNARTEGYNRVIKQIKRVACGFRNQDNYERRIMLHSAAHRAA